MIDSYMGPIPYGRQTITQRDIDSVVDTLKSDFLTQGPKIAEFESKFAKYVDSKYAVAVANGTAALHLSAIVMGVNSKSKVITTPITFAASANCVRYCGGEVVFADINSNTALLDIEKVEALLSSSAKGTYQGIIPVDFAGYPVNMQDFRRLADQYGLWIIEDACHAPGASYIDSKGSWQKSGNGAFADLAIFSFHPVKHIACGEGGMITTNNKELYERLLVLRTHGITRDPATMMENHGGWYYEMTELGFNYRLTDMQAALGISQLDRADQGLAQRRAIAKRYDEAFRNSPVTFIQPEKGVGHAYHLYIIEVANRKELYDVLRVNRIYAQVHYVPIHTMPYYQKLGFRKGTLPIAETYYERCISLPMFPALTEDQQGFVIETVLQHVK